MRLEYKIRLKMVLLRRVVRRCLFRGDVDILLVRVAFLCCFLRDGQSELQGMGTYFSSLLKIIVGIKPYLVTNNGELLIVQNIVRNGSLWWSNVFFEKEIIFHEFDFETSELAFEVPKSRIWKHTTSCDKGGFSSNIISQQIFRGFVFCA